MNRSLFLLITLLFPLVCLFYFEPSKAQTAPTAAPSMPSSRAANVRAALPLVPQEAGAGTSATSAGPQQQEQRHSGEQASSDDVRTSYYRGRLVTYAVVNGQAIYEGDIVLGTAEELEAARNGEDEKNPQAGGINLSRYLWPNGVVPFVISPNMSSDVQAAINHWNTHSNHTGINLVARGSQTNYIQFTSAPGVCSSNVGMQGGRQNINLDVGCGFGAVVHEIGHAIGLWHEQSRNDRDQFVTINWQNIEPGKEFNFNQYNADGVNIGDYDYGSIMHYGSTAFSINGLPTIVPKTSGVIIGQRNGLSTKDLDGARFLYWCVGSGAQVGENTDGVNDQQAFVTAYTRNGGKPSVGCPLNTVHRWLNGRIQDFNGGTGGKGGLMKADGLANAYWIHGGIWTYYETRGGPGLTFWDGSRLGYPVDDERRGANSSVSGAQTSYSDLQNGTINFYGTGTRAGQAYIVRGAILTQWSRACAPLCYEAGPLGMPTGEELAAPQSPFLTTGRFQDFESGQIYWHATGPRANSTFYVQHGIATKYKSLGGSASSLGFPISNEYAWPGGARNDFEGGSICWNSATGQATVGCTTPDTTAPVVTITAPTSNPTFDTNVAQVNIGGSASDNIGVTQVTWANNRGGSGTAGGTTSWSVNGIALQTGANVITVTARDAAGNTGSDTLTVNFAQPTRTLVVSSSNPNTGVSVSVSPSDTGGLSGGATQFTRTYNLNTTVTLTAPSTAGGNNFQKWQRNGADWSTSTTTTVAMDANHAMTAIYVTPPPPTRVLTVASSNPANGLGVSVSPNDNNGLGAGTTQFARTYNLNTTVTLTAPSTAGTNTFQKWQRDGADWSTSLSTTVTLDANRTMTAVYVTPPTPTRTLTVASFNPASGVSISASPNDNGGLAGGATQFARTYNLNTSVTLTAPATAGGNNFQKWQRDGADWSTSLTTTVTMDANRTMTAIYVTPPPPTRVLTIASSNPSNGLGVSVSPSDVNGLGGGATLFTRTYALNATVTLTAPSTAGANTFQKWQRDGVDWAVSLTTTVAMDANHTMTAVYATPPTQTRTLTVASFNPASGVSVSASPNDNGGLGGGTTQFARTYNLNTTVTLTAPSTAGGNNFQKWQRNGTDWSTNTTTSVTMDASYTMTAIYVAPPPPTRVLTIASLNPGDSLGVSVSPSDVNGQGGGATPFTRTYNLNATVTLTAPSTAGTNTFQKWQRDGVDWATTLVTSVTMDANRTMTAVYAPPQQQRRTLTVASLNPSNSLGVSVTPNDVNGLGGGATQFTRTYNLNTSVTLTAPSAAGVNVFQKWQRDGVDWSTSLTTTVTMDANRTMTAVYTSPPDVTGPALAVTSHTDNQTVTTNTITLGGTASDAGRGDSGVSSVTVNGVRASGDTAAGGATANWTRTLTLNEGANVINIVARDNSPAQNQTTRVLTINYQPPRRSAFDYDGDGRADLAVWRKTDGNWYVSNSSNGSTMVRAWGSQSLGDVPVGGDFDGDGRFDVAVWRASTGAWLIQLSSTGASRTVSWGNQSLGDVPVPGDYDGDRKTDVAVWRASTGAWLIQLSSTGASQTHALGSQSLGDVPVPADFDGDRRTDAVVWRASTGTWHGLNSSNGAAWSESWGSQGLGDVPLARDYDGDGRADCAVWRKTTGAWLIRNSSTGASRVETLGDQSLGDVPVPADFDADGRTDLAVWRSSTGVWHLVNSSTGTPLMLPWGSQSAGDVPLQAPTAATPPTPLAFNVAYAAQSGDFDNDGKTDVVVWRKSNGTWYVNNSSNNSPTSREWGVLSLGDVPVASDYDGDGRADVAVWRASNGTWYIHNSSNGTTTTLAWGDQSLGDVPVPADYDGDDKADVAVWRASTGTWFVRLSTTGALREQAWGTRSLGDVPVPGDYDGDGNADFAVWRATAGTWHILNSSTGVGRTVSFGVLALGDVPVPADYDGDGRTDVAVWRASNGTWFVSLSANGANVSRQWGVLALGDVPAPGDFDGDGRDDYVVWRASTGTWHVSSSGTGLSTSKQWGSQSLGDTPAAAAYVSVGAGGSQ